MPFDQWKKLAYGIERGDCVLFLGPELPAECTPGTRCIPARALTSRLVAGLRAADSAADAGNLARVAQRFLTQEDEFGLEMELKGWHGEMHDRASTLHANLAALPFRLIVTSNHDPLMETALRQAKKTPAVEFYHYRGPNKTLLPVPTVNEPLLFHLYGHISDASSIVLTETQLLDFLTALISKAPPLPADLNAALTNGKMFLFLGFGLRQWYLRILLHVLKVLRRGPPTFAVEIQPEDAGSPLDDAVLFYRENYRTEVYVTDVFDFVAELRQRCVPPPSTDAVQATPLPSTDATPATRGPKIFICHASEDRDTARNIHETLERSGFDPWLDKEDLRGGDAWDGLIESTIKDVDYVMVLNSQSLAAKTRGASYVNKEIKLALRAAEWRLGKFIIPVCIDTAPLVEPLTSYHAVNLATADGMRDLIRAVKKAGAT